MSEFFPACLSCSNNFNLLQSSSRSDDKNFVSKNLKQKPLNLAVLSNFIGVRSQVDFLPGACTSKFISFANSYPNFLSDKLA